MKPVTLRAWERRYGLIKPLRSESGRRMYTAEHITLVQRIQDMLQQGMSIGEVATSLRARPPEKHAQRRDLWWQVRRRMEAAVAQFDESALEALYNESLATHPLDLVTRKLLMPLLAELGARWESAEISVAEEHFFSMYVRNKIGARLHHRAPLTSGLKLLCACAPAEQHELGLMLFALAAHEAGMRSVLLGANAPLEDLPVACSRARCDAIVLSSSFDTSAGSFYEGLTSLVRRAEKPVFVGGAGSARHLDEIARAGAVALGADIGSGLRRLAKELSRQVE